MNSNAYKLNILCSWNWLWYFRICVLVVIKLLIVVWSSKILTVKLEFSHLLHYYAQSPLQIKCSTLLLMKNYWHTSNEISLQLLQHCLYLLWQACMVCFVTEATPIHNINGKYNIKRLETIAFSYIFNWLIDLHFMWAALEVDMSTHAPTRRCTHTHVHQLFGLSN